ncbi:hypothetical protein [Yersinia ruckeri]|uniref:hypothetical protein n=1 Tax=Yersinia ruckeri TaxID=29486 RepID=UPI002238A6CB|nr:hypothetical protein [Yersinia ruckeri]MCW6598756.1 hypothetical protein [Yersinia ruckeri]
MISVSIIESEASAWRDQTYQFSALSWDELVTLLFTGKYLKDRENSAFRFQFELADDRVIVAISEQGKLNTTELIIKETDKNNLPDSNLVDFLKTMGSEAILAEGTGDMAVKVSGVQVNIQKIGEKPVLLADKDIKEFVLLSRMIKQIKSNLVCRNIKSQSIGRTGVKPFFYEVVHYDKVTKSQDLDGLEITPQPVSKHYPPISGGETIQVLWTDSPANINEETEYGTSVLAGIKSIYETDAASNNNLGSAQH